MDNGNESSLLSTQADNTEMCIKSIQLRLSF